MNYIKIRRFLVAVIVILFVTFLIIVIIKILTKKPIEYMKHGVSYHLLKHPEWYQSIYFPEEAFPPREEKAQEYNKKVKIGYEIMKTKKIVITGLAKDISKNIYLNLKRMTKLGELFKDYVITIFENDSIDGTRTIIKEEAKNNPHIKLISCPENPECKLRKISAANTGINSLTRMERMADFRNRTVNDVRKNYSNFDYVLVLDWDITGPISFDGVATCFFYKDWHAMTAYGVVGSPIDKSGSSLSYYDSLAYVPLNKKPVKLNYLSLAKQTYKTWSLGIKDRSQEPIKVQSGFSGCAIYPIYVWLDNSVQYAGYHCEHVAFHFSMIKAGYSNIYINPAMMLLHTVSIPFESKKFLDKVFFF